MMLIIYHSDLHFFSIHITRIVRHTEITFKHKKTGYSMNEYPAFCFLAKDMLCFSFDFFN